MANTFVQIGSTVTVGSGGASSIDFTSIPSTYTDLILKMSQRGTEAAVYNTLRLRFNNDTTDANYAYRFVRGSGSAASSANSSASPYTGEGNGSSSTANTFSNYEIYIPNYAGSQQKSSSVDFVNENNATEAYAQLLARLWTATAAINQVTVFPSTGTFVQYSTATLYGIKNS
jgi:hypothetical protein